MQRQPSPLLAAAIRIASHVDSGRLAVPAFRKRKRLAADSPWLLGDFWRCRCPRSAGVLCGNCPLTPSAHGPVGGLHASGNACRCLGRRPGAFRKGACTCALSFVPLKRRGPYAKRAPGPVLPGAFADATPTRTAPPPHAACSPPGASHEGQRRLLQCPSWRLPPHGRWRRQQNRHTTPTRRIKLNKTELGCHKFDAIATMRPL